MKLYIVTETNAESNLLHRSWVCFTREQAEQCLAERYEIACSFNHIGGKEDPTDCLEEGFFFWQMDTIRLKYSIEESKTYAN